MLVQCSCTLNLRPASVAQLDARPTDDQEVAGSAPTESATCFRGDHEIFSTVILSLPLIQEGQLSVSDERMCTLLVNRLEDLACVWLGELTALNLTPMG